MRRRGFIACCATAACLPACGFRLRGTHHDATTLKSAIGLRHDEAPLLADYLLAQSGRVRVLEAGAEGVGPIRLQLAAEEFRQQAVGISPRTGRAVEFRLEYSVQARADYGDGRMLMQPQRVRAYEDYLLTETNVGNRSRLEILRRELLRRAAEHIQRRLLAALRLAP